MPRAASPARAGAAPARKYSVLLPCYNERENLPLMVALLDGVFTAAALAYEIVVVEDSSPDGTHAVALELQRVYGGEKLKVLKRPGKLGLGTAYIDGLQLCSGDFVILMDADLSHHVSGVWGWSAERGARRPRALTPPLVCAAQVHPRVHRQAGRG